MTKATQELVATVVMDDRLGDDRAEPGHAIRQPRWHAPPVERQIRASCSTGHSPFRLSNWRRDKPRSRDRRGLGGAAPISGPLAPAEAFVEGVARAAHGADRVAFAALRQPLAQTADVHVDRAFVDLRRSPPY